jgi:fructose-1,6-bisphosphatase/inositol monophosphatase family enzyme
MKLRSMPDEILDFMNRTARGAGKIIMKYRGKVTPTYKPDGSIATEADYAVRDFVRGEFSREFSGFGVLTEESKDSPERLQKENVFIADELDGSGDFERGEEDYCFLLAQTENGRPVRGVVYEPQKRRMFYAKIDGKAYLVTGEDNPVELAPLEPSLEWESSIVGHPKNYKGNKYTRLYGLLSIPEQRLLRSGSMGTRMMQVALQKTHMILGYTKSLKEWDIAAGDVILQARGISVTDIEGNPLLYNKEVPKTHNGILVAHPAIKDCLLENLHDCMAVLSL